MTQLKLKGPQIGSDLGAVAITIGPSSDNSQINSFKLPSALPVIPAINPAIEGDDLSISITGLTGITAYDWRVVGGATFSTEASPQRSFVLSTAVNGSRSSSATVTGTLPADLPASGTILILRNIGTYAVVNYSSYTGSTFTFTETENFGGGASFAPAGNDVLVMGQGGSLIECAITCDQGVITSLPMRLYPALMMGTAMPRSHLVDDRAVLKIIPHSDVTHYAVTDGAWNTPSIWNTGSVPRSGSVVLIPSGRTVEYDNTEKNIRLDRVRVDGRLWVDTINMTTQHYQMLVETLLVTQSGDLEVGTAVHRVPATGAVTFTISGKDYSSTSYLPTDIKNDNFLETRGWARGFLVQGRRSFWGAEKLTWAKADPIDAGATSLTLHEDPTGLSVGDTIVIGGTDTSDDGPMLNEDEERVVTGISGRVISWDTELNHPHKNQLSTSTRIDLYPAVLVKANKNITITSEVTSPVWRRGHDVEMHHGTQPDVWDTQFVELGRTDKSEPSGIINSDGDLELPLDGATTQTQALTPQSNLQSRYSFHLHHVGFGHPEDARPIVSNCYIGESPGWAVVHHSCDADFQKLGIYRFFGAGLVSEQANELGAWVDCLAMQTTNPRGGMKSGPKTMEGVVGAAGDPFRHGYGFAFRGRAMRTNRCVANSCSWGHVYFPRGTGDAATIVDTMPIKRQFVDLKEAGALASGLIGAYRDGEWEAQPYPIIHSADNESVACVGGWFVTKSGAGQFHDVNIRLKRFKSWGYSSSGATVEYIGTYLLDSFDCISGENGRLSSFGISIGANVQQVGHRNARVEGGASAFQFNPANDNDLFVQDDPKWFAIAYDAVGVTNEFNFLPYQDGNSNETVFRDEPDPNNTFITYDQSPSHTFPLVFGTIDGSGWTFQIDNADGNKVDNLSAVGEVRPKPSGELIWLPLTSDSFNPLRIEDGRGHYTFNGEDVMLCTDIISDRVTARPSKFSFLISSPTGTVMDGPFLGTLSYGVSPVTANDVTAIVAKNSSTTLVMNTEASPSGGDGSTYVLDTDDYISPDHGRAVLTSTTLKYRPDRDYTGTDETYVFMKSGERFDTVRITFLITEDGTDRGITTPVVDTDFSVADGASQSIDVTLNDKPDVSGRRIERVDYSTDAGATWRRLCNGWVKATHNITVESDGTAISNDSYNLRIRYRTDFDYVTSSASGDDVVTVT